jgi:hypothetical protein
VLVLVPERVAPHCGLFVAAFAAAAGAALGFAATRAAYGAALGACIGAYACALYGLYTGSVSQGSVPAALPAEKPEGEWT